MLSLTSLNACSSTPNWEDTLPTVEELEASKPVRYDYYMQQMSECEAKLKEKDSAMRMMFEIYKLKGVEEGWNMGVENAKTQTSR